MPELPEVETYVRGLRQPTVERTILSADFPNPPRRMINLLPEQFTERIVGQKILALTRRAKYLLFQLERDYLVIHLKLTGNLYVLPPHEETHFDRWLRVKFCFDNGQELRFSDPRRFGRVYLAHDPSEVLPELGPEPLDKAFTLAVFKQLLSGRKRVIKTLLLDQTFIAGVGNIYADESLHIAGIHPLRTADSLSAAEQKRLYEGIRQSLEDGIRHEGASVNWYRKPDGERGESQKYLRAYRGTANRGEPCPVCGGPITKIFVGQRGTHFCPTCQPEKPKSDRRTHS